MKINIKDILTLDDNRKYIVMSKIEYKNETYLHLVDIDNYQNIKYTKLNNDELSLVTNKEILKILIPKFYKESLREIKSDIQKSIDN